MSHIVMRLKWAVLTPLMPKDYRKAFHRDGFVRIDGFLDPQSLASLKAELPSISGDVRQLAQGDTYTQRILLDDQTLTHMPVLRRVARDPHLKDWIGYAGGLWRRPLLYVQKIHNGAREGSADPQKTMHADTFHPSVKAWLFLEDVSLDQGPFTYVRGSHALTSARLKFEYQTSITAAGCTDGYTEKGSFRLTEDGQKAMELPDPESLSVPAGTLVIANTFGFHGRGQAVPGATRLELWAYSRHTPFLPWPGLGVDLVTRVTEWILPKLWTYRDKKAARQGRRASWHLIDKATFFKGESFTLPNTTDRRSLDHPETSAHDTSH